MNWAALQDLSRLSTAVILGLFLLHVCAFGVLLIWAARERRRIADVLFDFTRGVAGQSLLSNVSAADQTDAFLADIGDIVQQPPGSPARIQLADRICILDERRGYLRSGLFPTAYNVARTMIEAYPLLGVLGTILAIGSALQKADATVQDIVARFGDAIWSTGAGLTAGIVLLFINGFVEPGFNRLIETRRTVRETVAVAKRELMLTTPATAAGADA